MQQRAAGRGPARGAHGHGIADPRRDVRGGTERYPGGGGLGRDGEQTTSSVHASWTACVKSR